MKIEVSNGELLDKFCILQIKKDKIKGHKLDNVLKEWKYLKKKVDSLRGELDIKILDEIFLLMAELVLMNARLWDIEDELRKCEKNEDFGERFVALARQVYITNDKRSNIKKQINLITESKFVEEKSY